MGQLCAALGRDFVPLLQTLVPDLLDRKDTDVSDICDPNTTKLCRDKKLISFYELVKYVVRCSKDIKTCSVAPSLGRREQNRTNESSEAAVQRDTLS